MRVERWVVLATAVLAGVVVVVSSGLYAVVTGGYPKASETTQSMNAPGKYADCKDAWGDWDKAQVGMRTVDPNWATEVPPTSPEIERAREVLTRASTVLDCVYGRKPPVEMLTIREQYVR